MPNKSTSRTRSRSQKTSRSQRKLVRKKQLVEELVETAKQIGADQAIPNLRATAKEAEVGGTHAPLPFNKWVRRYARSLLQNRSIVVMIVIWFLFWYYLVSRTIRMGSSKRNATVFMKKIVSEDKRNDKLFFLRMVFGYMSENDKQTISQAFDTYMQGAHDDGIDYGQIHMYKQFARQIRDFYGVPLKVSDDWQTN